MNVPIDEVRSMTTRPVLAVDGLAPGRGVPLAEAGNFESRPLWGSLRMNRWAVNRGVATVRAPLCYGSAYARSGHTDQRFAE